MLMPANDVRSLKRRQLQAACPNAPAAVQVFKQNGLERYRPLKDKFDPNLHSALFEIPDPLQKPGTVAVVTKVGEAASPACIRLCLAPCLCSKVRWCLTPGCCAVQAGYRLHDRVLRPAEVGVVRAADGASAPGGPEVA